MTDKEHRPPEPPCTSNSDRKPTEADQQTTLNGTPVPSSNMIDQIALKKAQKMVIIASIAGPVSLFIGGVLLSGIGFACAIISFRKLKTLIAKHTDVSTAAMRLKRSAIIGIAICGVSFVLNAIAFALMMPVMMGMIESGNYPGIMSDIGSGAANPNSTWG